MKSTLRNNQPEMSASDIPFLKEHLNYEIIVQQFLKKIKYTLLDDNDLTLEVPNITLELREGTPSVYNCLFEDMSSFYPY
ncbi:hypothetical protein ACQKII_02430 [Lysinibacillus sp. NPDC048646]|uniref:hypothetical protein n=1 Tax=Lysinibacillus sp. NPDC048646 TaxID=3390574 RepID=UPI003CFE10E5